MKVRKNGIEIAIRPEDKQKYVRAGWEVKYERNPELTRKYYATQKQKKEGKSD